MNDPVINDGGDPVFWIMTPCNWESAALTHLINSFGWSVSKTGRLDDNWPICPPDKTPSMILAVIGEREIKCGTLLELFEKHPDMSIALLLRRQQESSLPISLPTNVMATIDANHSSLLVHSSLQLALAGHRVLTDNSLSASKLGAKGKPAPSTAVMDLLTRREREVSHEISRGRSNKEIARRLGISPNTVNAHAAAIRQKLGVSNRTQIAFHFSNSEGVPSRSPSPLSPH
jgi:DNA-binding NarL/FixJ family response regulator